MPSKPRTYRPPNLPTQRERSKRHDEQRGSSTQRGYGAAWQRASKAYKARHPLCVECLKRQPPRTTAVYAVDHVIPHKGDMELFWDEDNWQSLCKFHHDRKTAKEDGAFGRPVRG